MIEKYINNLPLGINLTDILALIILILIITHIIGSINRRKIKKELASIPGYDINSKLISDISDINQKLDEFSIIHRELKFGISNLTNRSKDIVDIKTIKYNPYKDMGVGGNQSFSTAMVDKNGNGIILTNLYSRERTRVLLKEIKEFQPTQELAPEEKEVLSLIKNN
jgi:hypothetical protein